MSVTDQDADSEAVMIAADRYTTALSSDGATLAKVIATFGVVLTHSYKLFRYMGVQESEVFYLRGFHAFAACGVTVFFLLSGYFLVFKGNWDYKKNLKKKFKSLVIPYCLFMLNYALISMVGSLVLPAFFDDFRQFTAHDWLMHLFGIPFVTEPNYYGPLWFIRELVVLNILSVALVPAVKRIPDYLLIPPMVVIYFLPISRLIRYSIPFFIVGMCFGFKKYIPVLNKLVYGLFILIIGFLIPVLFEGELSWKISVLLMAISIVLISGKLIENSNVKKMAQTAIPLSFPVYLLHEYPMTTLTRLLAMKHISVFQATVAFFVLPFFVIGICVLVVIIWKRFAPRTYSIFMGNR